MAVATCSAERSYTASRTQVVSASTRCETHAPPAVNFSAAPTCSGLSRTMSCTTTLVSTARMPLADVLSDCVLHVHRPLWSCVIGKQCVVDILRCITPCPANDDLIALLVPFEYGTGADAEFLANFGRNRDLTLSGHFRLCDSHTSHYPSNGSASICVAAPGSLVAEGSSMVHECARKLLPRGGYAPAAARIRNRAARSPAHRRQRQRFPQKVRFSGLSRCPLPQQFGTAA
jgi:hypothetical protein